MSQMRILKRYTQRSTIQGVAHFSRTTNSKRKIFWLLLTLAGTVISIYHMVAIWEQYTNTPVNVSLQKHGEKIRFPDVTLCNLQPFSASVVSRSQSLKKTVEEKWGNFEQIMKVLMASGKNTPADASYVEYYDQLLEQQMRLAAIFWASEDTRDYGHDKNTFILDCRYKNEDCSHWNFKLVQNFDFMNCYTLLVPDRHIEESASDQGLQFVLYTNNFLRGDNDTEVVLDESYVSRNNFTKHYEEFLGFRQILSSGVRVLIHHPNSYPYSFNNGLDVANGLHANIRFEMSHVDLVNRASKPCVQRGRDYRRFLLHSNKIKKFQVFDYDFLIMHYQRAIYRVCECYSHTLPIEHEKHTLCYFLDDPLNLTSIARTKNNIDCHDKTIKEAQEDTKNWLNKYVAEKACTQIVYNQKLNTSPWPNKMDALKIYKDYIFKALNNKTIDDQHFKERRILKDIVEFVGDESHANATWKASMSLTKRNFVRINIFSAQTMAESYREVPSYFIWEAFAEIGGVFGLYMGMTLLTVCELVELIILLIINCMNSIKMKSTFSSKRKDSTCDNETDSIDKE